ncbi:hypothetical protein ASPCADRAFT_135533 [Aspergillus carbonarius ITEM 5010]|uniref:Uncharacterized protein n=1 Tax=Aspergillus carbonarius (strain ITEM 5010) TaxID=602072 RepID=A0A1R3R672_ASPC5|nr:hypothetical protein ASPCADRAFT_135533 [Aspergillus carbonarius ITEM 5010]
MFNPNIPIPGRREHHPIVIADDDSDSDDIIPEEEEEGEDDDSDENLDHDTDSDEMELDYSLHSRSQAGIMGYETLPQSRRRFLSRLLAPEDPESAASIRADRFTVQHAHASTSSGGFSASSAAMIVPRRVVDVYETDDAGWRRPERGGRGGGGGAPGSAMQSSPGSVGSGSVSSAKMKGRMGTPDRVGRGAKGRGLQSSSYRERERERERRRGLFEGL